MIEFAYEMLVIALRVVIEFAYEMLAIALRVVGALVFWGSLICLFWGVATLCRVVMQWVKRYMSWLDDPIRVVVACAVAAYVVYVLMERG